ncbi:hypothetical protein [Flavobacterium silvaticum]|uniref:Lipoprotein n=1 Tax=Flavobacterium silvaticum TaxID=1852020 RepID=A0A972JHG0_9FLAO|nr:hypothetical protein [Flavobacterium silvaticum]NMH27885.1 hypothetical protein [Flavobacterium silvaticum]
MRRLFLFIAFAFAVTASCQCKKLPVPDKAFLKSTENSNQVEIDYFTKYIGSASKLKVIRNSYGDTTKPCEMEQRFKNGIVYHETCSDSGSDVKITFPSYCKEEIVKFVDWFFLNEFSIWNKSKTTYSPIEDGDAGCYLEIKQDKSKHYFLEYYCGC